jgi:UMF1 family MFS transporter
LARVSDTAARRRVFAWCLFDWANSPYTTLVVPFVYSAYFVQAFAPDAVTGTAWWSRAVAVAAIAVAVRASPPPRRSRGSRPARRAPRCSR